MPTIQENLQSVISQIREFELRFHRKSHSVFLLAVSKGQSLAKIEEAILAGQKAFGENYLQEALKKIEALADKKLDWHFIGPIQRNKTRKIAKYFNWVHSVDDKIIAQRLNDQRPDELPPLNICIEVNVSSEASKSGLKFDQVEELARYCSELPRIKLRGLMTVPRIKKYFIDQRAEFYKLRLIDEFLSSKGFKIDTLSMGMSHDMEAAIAEGATMVRIGTNIFGQRNL